MTEQVVNSTSLVIDGLVSCEQYGVAVSAVTRWGTGPATDTVNGSTAIEGRYI